MSLDRRHFLSLAGAFAATGGPAFGAPEVSPEDFSFVHLTDTHIQSELHAGEGCRLCFDKINSIKPNFIINGGDLVNGSNGPIMDSPLRSKELYDLYTETAKRLRAPLHHVIGNHDICGMLPAGVRASSASYNKRMFEDCIGKPYYSFVHKGWQFIILDSIYIPANSGWAGRIDDDQLTWLSSELAAIPPDRPLVVITHIPLVTGYFDYVHSPAQAWQVADMKLQNSKEVLDLLWPYNLKAVLQGHTHYREIVNFKSCQFITSGAVCGNWWKGPLAPKETADSYLEGFGVVTVKNGELAWRYESYGFHADPPVDTAKPVSQPA